MPIRPTGPATHSLPVSAAPAHRRARALGRDRRLDHTYASASPSSCDPLLLSSSRTVVPVAAAVLSGSQTVSADPFGELQVDRAAPPPISSARSAGPLALDDGRGAVDALLTMSV